AGGGRFLILHLSQLRQLAVLDVSEARIVKYLPLASDDIAYAAGADKLVVLLRDKKILQRWSLTTLERDLAVPFPPTLSRSGEQARSMVMGSASHGPLLLATRQGDRGGVTFLDLDLKPLDTKWSFPPRDGWYLEFSNADHLRASANGRVFLVGAACFSLSGNYLTVTRDKSRISGTHPLPNADGSLIYAPGGVITSEMKRIGQQQPM